MLLSLLCVLSMQTAAELQGFDTLGSDRRLAGDILSALQRQIRFLSSYRLLGFVYYCKTRWSTVSDANFAFSHIR